MVMNEISIKMIPVTNAVSVIISYIDFQFLLYKNNYYFNAIFLIFVNIAYYQILRLKVVILPHSQALYSL